MNDNEEPRPPSNTGKWLIVSWLWVGTPLAWGVLQTVYKSLALFR